jgi:hypothetical protein
MLGTVFDHTNSCTKQYHSATAIYRISTKNHVTINHVIGAPGHGKDVVGALNTKIQQTWGKTKTVFDYSIYEKQEVVSLAGEAVRLCALEQSEGAKGGKDIRKEKRKSKNEEANIYHIRKQEGVVHHHLKCTIQDLSTSDAHMLASWASTIYIMSTQIWV